MRTPVACDCWGGLAGNNFLVMKWLNSQVNPTRNEGIVKLISLAMGCLAALMLLAPMRAQSPAEAHTNKTLRGTVSCLQCRGMHDFHKGRPPTSCVRECVRDGSSYALIVGKKAYVLRGNDGQLQKVAGGKAMISGQLDGNTITVTTSGGVKK